MYDVVCTINWINSTMVVCDTQLLCWVRHGLKGNKQKIDNSSFGTNC